MSRDITHLDKLEWMFSPLLGDCLPYVFPNGVKFNGLNVKCFDCEATIKGPNVRGTITQSENNSCILTAKAICQDCQQMTLMNYRITGNESVGVEILDDQVDTSDYNEKMLS